MNVTPKFSILLAAAVIACSSVVSAARATPATPADTITLRVHHPLPPAATGPAKFIGPWCDKIQRESNGRLQCKIFPAMQLGGTPAQLFDQAKDGVVDLIWTIPNYQAGRFPVTEVFELPFIVQSSEQASRGIWQFMQRNGMTEYKGIKPLVFHLHDGNVLHTSKVAVRRLEDFRGLKLRAPTRQATRLLGALGATPVPMPLPQTAESMAKGVIDGALAPWEVVTAIKLDEIARHHTELPAASAQMSNSVFMLGMNQARYDSLPPELKKVIDTNSGPEMSAKIGRLFAESRAAGRQAAQARKNSFVTISGDEYQRWVKASEGVAEQWVKEVTAAGLDGTRLLKEARDAAR